MCSLHCIDSDGWLTGRTSVTSSSGSGSREYFLQQIKCTKVEEAEVDFTELCSLNILLTCKISSL